MKLKNHDRLTEHIADNLFEFANVETDKSEIAGYSNYSYWRSTVQVFLKNKTAVVFLGVIVILLLFTLIQPFLPGQKDPTFIHINPETFMQFRNIKPGSEFWFGTNAIGQDLWARIWSGTRTSLLIGFAVGLFEVVIGIIIGTLWGYVKKLDRIITEIYNVWNNIPTTVVLILLTYIFRPSLSTLIFAMAITGWLSMARLVRNLVTIIRDREYNMASRCLGTPTYRILTKNMLPYLVSVIMLRVALAIPMAIGAEVFLTYIGLGLPVQIPSLGNLVNEGRVLMMSESLRYQLFFPAIVISMITISFYVMGNAFADAADPKNHV
ncbi:MAG: ABC transporter permease [Clostridiales bacterium]|nr:ABC transporter permease [Clostridiales bacterium]